MDVADTHLSTLENWTYCTVQIISISIVIVSTICILNLKSEAVCIHVIITVSKFKLHDYINMACFSNLHSFLKPPKSSFGV